MVLFIAHLLTVIVMALRAVLPDAEVAPPPPVPEPILEPAHVIRFERFTREELRPLLEEYDWPVESMLLIIFGPTSHCPNGESAGYPAITSAGGHRGLLQIHPMHAWRFERRGWTWDDAWIAEFNIAIAYELYLESGLQPWSCRPR